MGLPHTDKPTPTSKFSISGNLPYLLVGNAWRGDGQSVSDPLPGCTGRHKCTRELKFSKYHCIEEIYRFGIPVLPRSLSMHHPVELSAGMSPGPLNKFPSCSLNSFEPDLQMNSNGNGWRWSFFVPKTRGEII